MELTAKLWTLAALALTALPVASQQSQQAPRGAPVNIVGPLPVPVTGSTSVLGTVTIRDADNAARQPFQVELCRQIGGTGNLCGAVPSFYTVSPNRRLVIEYASGRCPPSGLALSTGSDWVAAIQTTAGGRTARHVLSTVPGISIGTP